MPELPEVETTRRGLRRHLRDRSISRMIVREPRLRWPIASDLPSAMLDRRIVDIHRRAKYLLFELDRGALMIHLGMSGSLRIMPEGAAETAAKHDHVEWHFDNGLRLRFNDPRRFGSIHELSGIRGPHFLLDHLGAEPLDNAFDGTELFRRSRGRKAPVKTFIMDHHHVVGVGNIYASEALFRAGIHPRRGAGRVSLTRYKQLADCIREVLSEAIAAGGTTLRDFVSESGRPGYFRQHLLVYGKADEPCPACGTPVRSERIGQRNTFFCVHCQT